MTYGCAEPIVPPARQRHRRKFSEAYKRRIVDEAVQPGERSDHAPNYRSRVDK
jgi:hypothetical protein